MIAGLGTLVRFAKKGRRFVSLNLVGLNPTVRLGSSCQDEVAQFNGGGG